MILNNNFWFFFDIMMSILEVSIFFYFVNDDKLRKRSLKSLWLSFFIFILLIILVNTINIHLISNERATISIFLCLIFYKFNYEINIIKCVVGTLIFWMMLISIDSISMVFVKFANSLPDFSPLFIPGIFRLELIAITKTLLILTTVYIKYFKLLSKITSKDFLYLIIPIITNIFSLFLVFGKDIINLPNRFWQDMSFVLISIFVILSNVFLVFIILKIIRDNKTIEKQKLLHKKKVMENDYYIKVEENNEKVRKLYHDMKNHLICIGNLCDNVEAKKYVESLKFELNKLDNVYNTGNRVLDIILNKKSSICAQKEIKLYVYVDFSKSEFIDELDVDTIFSNALDNAIKACDKIEEDNFPRTIELKSSYINNFCIIKIINSKSNMTLTDKKDRFLHGFEISNIKEAASKYNGQVIIKYSDNKFLLTIVIPIPINII